MTRTSTANSVGTDGRIASGSEPTPLSDDAVAVREALNRILDVSLRMNPNQSFNAEGRLARCAEIAEQALQAIEGEG